MSEFHDFCKQIRLDIIDMLAYGERGHVISALSIVEIVAILYKYILNFQSDDPLLPSRDRFILSKGHGCMALYSVLARMKFFPISAFKTFCKPGGLLGGHPSRQKVPGIEISTGSLGQGFSVAVGMAIHAKKISASHKIFVLLGDGECNEGSIWEAALSANKHQLDNLRVLIDCNQYQSYDQTSVVCPMDSLEEKWHSFGFNTAVVDMQTGPLKLIDHLTEEQKAPTVILCKTIKGQGIPILEGNLSWHHKLRPTKEEIELLRGQLLKNEE